MPTKPPGTPDVDLTTAGSFGTIDDAVFQTALAQSAGTGGFNTFVQIQHNGIEQGYNSDNSTEQFDEKNAHHHSLLLANVPIVIGDGTNGTVDGVAYREFLLDLNEPAAQQFLSLDRLQIWQEESGSLGNFTSGMGFAGAHTNYLAYDLDAGADRWIGLNDGLSHGSGQSDVAILIPDSFFINDTAHRYVYLYSAFGLQSGWGADGGFEEWGVSQASGPPGTTAALSMSKAASVPGGTADHAGEVVTYTIQLYNVGDKSLTGITMTDGSVSDLTRGADIVGNNDNVLDVGETWSFTAHHMVTQAEIDSNGAGTGQISNTATADSNETGPVTASTSVAIEQNFHASLVKSASVPGGTADTAGDLITYTIALTNDGLSTLTSPVVTDSMVNIVTPILDFSAPILDTANPLLAPVLVGDNNIGDTNQNGVEDPGETFQFTIAGDDNNNGIQDPGEVWAFGNIGDANHNGVQDPGETFQFYNAGDTNRNGVEDPGETFQFLVSHQVAGVDADNDLFNDGDTNHDGLLNVGETWQFSFTHTVTQDEIDNGGVVDPGLTIDNTASAATDQVDPIAAASASVPVEQRPHVTLVKDATVPGGTADAAGEVISYTIDVTNDGNMTLTDPVVSDPFVSDLAPVTAGGFNSGDADHDGKLDVGETWHYTANHAVSQTEIDAGGSIANTASVTTDQGATASGDASVTVVQHPHLTLEKSGTWVDGDADGLADPGEHIDYSFLVTNDGNVTLHNVVVNDPLLGGPVSGPDSGDSINPGVLDVGETWTFHADYAILQGDIDAGHVHNTATATALGPQNQPASDNADNDTTLPQSAHLMFAKTGLWTDGDADGFADAGEQVHYTFVVTNDGNVSLHNVAVSDPLLGGPVSGPASGDSVNPGILDIRETWTYQADYVLTQTDVDNGNLHNSAAATALGPQGQTAGGNASTDVALPQPPAPAMSLDMSTTQFVDNNENNVADDGDLIQFGILLKNLSGDTLTNIMVSDSLGAAAGSLQTPIPASLDPHGSPGDTWPSTYNFFLGASDIAAGHVSDDLTVTALDSQGHAQSVTAHWDQVFPI